MQAPVLAILPRARRSMAKANKETEEVVLEGEIVSDKNYDHDTSPESLTPTQHLHPSAVELSNQYVQANRKPSPFRKDLTEKQEAFLQALFDPLIGNGGQNVRKAMDTAGYSKSVRQWEVLEPLKDEIVARATYQLATASPSAVMGLLNVLEDPTKPGAKNLLQAAKEVLDRAGVLAAHKVNGGGAGGNAHHTNLFLNTGGHGDNSSMPSGMNPDGSSTNIAVFILPEKNAN